jgi:hypothetical protein
MNEGSNDFLLTKAQSGSEILRRMLKRWFGTEEKIDKVEVV